MAAVDFAKLFSERLERVRPVPEQFRAERAYPFQDIGVTAVKRTVPCVQFDEKEPPYVHELWVGDGKERGFLWTHIDVSEGLNRFREAHGFREIVFPLSGYVVQDGDDHLYLLSTYFGFDIMSRGRVNDGWSDFMERYRLERLVVMSGGVPLNAQRGMLHVVVESDSFGKLREEGYLRGFAEKYGMSTSQYLRFHHTVRAAWDAKLPTDCDGLARKIVQEG